MKLSVTVLLLTVVVTGCSGGASEKTQFQNGLNDARIQADNASRQAAGVERRLILLEEKVREMEGKSVPAGEAQNQSPSQIPDVLQRISLAEGRINSISTELSQVKTQSQSNNNLLLQVHSLVQDVSRFNNDQVRINNEFKSLRCALIQKNIYARGGVQYIPPPQGGRPTDAPQITLVCDDFR